MPYTKAPSRFFFRGISTGPGDALPEGKLPYGKNIRAYNDGTLQPRYGINKLTTAAAMSGEIRSIIRLNDPTPYASIPTRRFVATSDGKLFGAAPSATNYGAALDTGYSGNPISGVITVPMTSPEPWLYVGDSTRMRKANVNATVYPIGLTPPTAAPSVVLGAPGQTLISDFDAAASWGAVGGIAAAPTNVTPINTTISQIVYDSGNTGYASIAATDMTSVIAGKRVTLAAAETVLITDILIAIAATTIGAIAYDAGTTGLCTIQPAASLGTGQLEGPSFQDYVVPNYPLDPSTPGSVAPPSLRARIRQVDFPVHCLVRINSGGGSDEVVQILSVSVGQDGIQSFRCSTANTHAAAETLTGIAGFRAFTVNNRAITNTIVGAAVQQVITPLTTAPVVAGLNQTGMALNLALVGGRATQPEDDLWISFKADLLSYVQEVRLMLDVDGAATNFLSNYFMAVWRANDIASAIQATNAATTTTVQDARSAAVLQNQIDQPIVDPNAGPSSAESSPNFDPSIGYYTAQAPPPMVTGGPTATGAQAAQLAIGNSQWISLRVHISELIRVGTDTTRTLANVAGVQVLVQFAGYAGAVTCQFDSALIQGGYGADVGDTAHPYLYCYRYRSSITGARSNPSPPTRGGIVPRRQRVTVTPTAPGDAQADLIDYFRFGGGLTGWTYSGSSAAAGTYPDDNKDGAIDGGESLRFDLFQPWPVPDLPRTGTGTVVGTSLQRTAGDNFDTSWAPGSAITVNGQTTTLYAQPSSTTRLELATSCGNGVGVTWSIKEPIKLSQPLPGLWGGPLNNVVFLFACGDLNDPGSLHWSHGNDPDTTSDANWLSVTSASEPLQNGVFYDGTAFVFSTDNLYRILPTFGLPIAGAVQGETNTFRAQGTACGRGLWTRWAFDVAPEGIYFLAKDGLYLTAWGGQAEPICDPDLMPLFPTDGAAGVPYVVNGVTLIDAPDMTQTAYLRLTYVDGFVYFDYKGVGGSVATLIYERAAKRWYYDVTTPTTLTRAWEEGSGVHDQILGSATGNLYQYSKTAFADAGVNLPFAIWTPWLDGGEPRQEKQYGDLILDYDPSGMTQNVTVTPVYNSDTASVAPSAFGAGASGRQQHVIELSDLIARNLGIQITGTQVTADTGRPTFYLWEPSWLPKAPRIKKQATDWNDLGYPGAKFIQGIALRANTFNVAKSVQVQYDGGQIALTLSITHNGEVEIVYPIAAAGWTPFVAQLVRLVGADTVDWLDLGARWIFEPAPEAATEWQTQPTTHDLPGYQTVHDATVGYASPVAVTLSLAYEDGGIVTTTLPSTGNVNTYRRAYVPLAAGKGRAVTYTWTAAQPFRLFKRDCSMRVQGWGLPNGYVIAQPFGGPSRADGATV